MTHYHTNHARRRSDSESDDGHEPNLGDHPAVHVYQRRVVEHESYLDNYKLHKLRPVKELETIPLETTTVYSPPPPVPSQDYPHHGGGSPHRHRSGTNNGHHTTTTSPSSVGLWRPTSNTDSRGRLHYIEPKEGGGRLTTYRGVVGKRMGSPQMFANGSIAIRILVLLLAIVGMILIMTAPGVCFWRTINGQQTSREICPPSNSIFPMNIDRWTSALHFQMRGQNVWGQLALIILSILFALPPLIFSCVYFTTGRNFSFSQIMASGVAVLAFLIFGAVEVWYATGYNHMGTFIRQIGGGTFSGCAGIPACEVGFVVKGWAVAAAFYFLAAILYALDAILVFLKRDK